MLSADGGGGGGTDWMSMSMSDMWATVENQETTSHWQLLTGWQRSYELTLQHMSAVRSYRDNLASAWPPEKSKAAEAYVARLNELLTYLQGTYDAAVANHSAFSTATLALSSTRTDLQKLVTEYSANETKITDYEHAKTTRLLLGGKGGAPPLTKKNPVPDGRQAELETQARRLMSGLSTELVQARTQIRTPAKYSGTEVGEHTKDDSSSSYTAPPIPTVTPFDPNGTNSSSGSLSSSTSSARTQEPVGLAPNTPASASPSGRLPGLVLGGNQPPVLAPPTPSPINPPPIVGGPPASPIGPMAPVSPLTPGFSGSNTSSPGRAGARPVPPGGVIGGRPGTPILGQPTAGRPPTAANPFGGVISPSPTGKPGVPGARSAPQPVGAMGSRPLDADKETEASQKWDPDNPWATAKGVDPVLMPSEEQRIDPGPAIGLS